MSEQLKHKMQQYEATPPPGCWDAIASRLHDASGHASAAVLYNMEIPPPPAAWNNIAAALDGATALPKAPAGSAYRYLYRAAAVAALLIIGIGSWWLTSRPSAPVQAVKPAPAAGPARQAASVAIQSNTPANADDNDTEDASGSLNGYRTPTRRPLPVNARTLKYTSVNILPSYREYPITVAHASPPANDDAIMTRNMNTLLMDDNYLIISGPNGETTRASLKMADALRYLYGSHDTDETTDKTNNENSHWKKRLQEWRNKILSSHFIPASTNFLDIIDLKDLIDEKQ